MIISCNTEQNQEDTIPVFLPSNTLDYSGNPSTPLDRNSLMFSDQGAWFAYGFSRQKKAGFTGPFLMTQGHGEWSSKMLSQLELVNTQTKETVNWNEFTLSQVGYNSHLEQLFENKNLIITQTLFYPTPHSAIITTQITNLSGETLMFQPNWRGTVFSNGLQIAKEGNRVTLTTTRSTAKGIIQTYEDQISNINTTDSSYSIALIKFEVKPNETKTLRLSQTFIFPEYDLQKEQQQIELVAKTPLGNLRKRKSEKENQLLILNNKLDSNWQDSIYKDLVAKTVLTLQNNTRIAAGELKHAGLFPSYQYIWFHGFWAWDSWKHAVALAQYDAPLAKEQIKAMYAYLTEDGFIPDCIFRDTTIENHNYRNTKPPLSAWSVWKVYQQSHDINFLKELYPKIISQHNWWYNNRDHDKDGICEYGSTDGSLVAAKWESGMDNAVRFDNSKILKNSENAYSLDQESVDLNAYLYAEKKYIIRMAEILEQNEDFIIFNTQAGILKTKIQSQFFDKNTGWFYDTSIDGKNFIDVMGCEGWIPLWANVATDEQAKAIKNNMMNPDQFNTKVPFQTLSANHPDFKPNGGYWRGPNWLDQAYFGTVGLHNYGYHEDAYQATYKLIHNAEGVLDKGPSIRENYQPITGAGLESQNFSWSAAHYLLLLINE